MINISIVTINYNNKEGLLKTFNSIKSIKLNSAIEWIVIDGNSTDGSKELLFNFKVPFSTKIISEDDTGIYNAMNKGITYASGNYVLFLNSGDILYNEYILEIFLKERLDPKIDVYLFDFFYFNKKRRSKPIWWRFWSLPTSHQSIIYKKEILEIISFDEKYKFAADFNHFIQIAKLNLKFAHINEVLSANEAYGSDVYINEVQKEYYNVLLENTNYIIAFLINNIKFFYIKMLKKIKEQ